MQRYNPCNSPGSLGRSRAKVEEPRALDDAEIYAVYFSAERPRIALKVRNGKRDRHVKVSNDLLPKLPQSHPILLPCYLHLLEF